MITLLLFLILAVMLGVIAFDMITTIAGGVIAGVILLIVLIVRSSKRKGG